MTITQVATQTVLKHSFYFAGTMTVATYFRVSSGIRSDLTPEIFLDDGTIIGVAFSSELVCSCNISIRTKTFAATTYTEVATESIVNKRMAMFYRNDNQINISSGQVMALWVAPVSGQTTPQNPRIDVYVAYPHLLTRITDLSG